MDDPTQLSVIQEESESTSDEVGELSSLLQETATSIIRTILFFKDRGVIPFEYLCFLQRLSRELTKPPQGLQESDLYSVSVDATGDGANITYPDQPPASPQIEQQRTFAEAPGNSVTQTRAMSKSFPSVRPRRLYEASPPPLVSPTQRNVNATGSPAGGYLPTSALTGVTQGVPFAMSATSPVRMNVAPEVLACNRCTTSPSRKDVTPGTAEQNRSAVSTTWKNATQTMAPATRSPAWMNVTPEAVARGRSTVSPTRMNVTPGTAKLNRSAVSNAWKNATQTIAPATRSPARINVTPEAVARGRSTVSPTRMNVTPGTVEVNRSAVSPAWKNATQTMAPATRSPARMNVTPEAVARGRSTVSPTRMNVTPGTVEVNRSAVSTTWKNATQTMAPATRSPARMNVTPEAVARGRSTVSPTRMNVTQTMAPLSRSPTRMNVTPETVSRGRSVVYPTRMNVTPGTAEVNRSSACVSPAWRNATQTIAPFSKSVRSPTRVDASYPASLSRSAESPGRMNLTRNYSTSNKSTRMDRTPEALRRSLAASQASTAKYHTPRSVTRVYGSPCPMKCEGGSLYYLLEAPAFEYEDFNPECESTHI